MKAKVLVFAFLLCACTSPKVASSDVASSFSSKEDLTSSLSEDLLSRYENLIAEVKKANGNPIALDVTKKTTYHWLTDGAPLSIEGIDTFHRSRFQVNEGKTTSLITQKGEYAIGDSRGGYEMQCFDDKQYFYQLMKEDDGTKTKTMDVYSLPAVTSFYHLDFSFSNESNIRFLEQYLEQARFSVKTDFGEPIDGDGTYHFSYSILQYVDSQTKVPELYQGHDYEIVVKDGIIISSKETYDYENYAGGRKTNWQQSITSIDYVQGKDYPQFSGEIWNPNEFQTESSSSA